ncbi:MAG: class I SAM-dependent methyltransferase [Comamonadaceae bacterium]|jgi:2-polyprenyl-6-hydroxyphenyl methylase/3-demethylubiquinone-9 3-methyltransferase|uniref:Class I SAM-dependent methyltransferase n=1 Tax=Hydrogenophaga borbori TaxID=2294117 RepID=A0A372EIY5_9BURK|nr:class I SAM-dependent methyltransferase [Hydrogenophaga borbori]NCT99433.1 class I SAM-dependent methyltransferase [Comamonadaceae bacterium]RFP78614.1 class I SAM-dependent methyltransferase [Hydrogenophaga borbori]
MPDTQHAAEVDAGNRFRFGENWARFLRTLNEARIAVAEQSLKSMLGRDTLAGLRFIDVGSGSGLFSLAARRLGAQVHSFDFDPQSVQCAMELRSRYFPDDAQWTIQEGSVLDADFIDGLGQHDIVYSWGVLHHTGEMWKALELVTRLVRNGGQLFIAIYNDQGHISRRWTSIKKLYCSGPLGRLLVKAVCIPYFVLPPLLLDLVKLRDPTRIYREYYRERGMSRVHDWYDWLGGYPFEVAKPEEIFDFYTARGFRMERMTTCGGGLGCNQFVFRRSLD